MKKKNQTKLIVENLNTVDVFLNTSSDIICILDTKGHFKYVNSSFLEITEYLESELLLKTFFDFLDPKETLSISKKIKSLSKENQKISFVSKYLVQNKLYKTISWKVLYIEDDNTLFVTGKDITEENSLAKEAENIKMALDESAIVAITNQKGVITFVNDKFCKISKYSREELIGKDHKIINSGYHSKEFIKNIWQTIASGGIWKGEIKNLAKDKSFYWVDTTIVPFFDNNGKPTQYIAIRSDITAKKKAEEDLIEAKKIAENIKMALDESAIVAITNQKGVITFVNDKFCEISKYSREELIGKDHKIINSGYHSKEFIKNIWQTIASGGIWKGEIKNIAKDGNYYWVDTTIVPSLNDKGKPTKYTAIRSDITAKKKAEEDLIEAKKIAENIKMALDESAIVAITNQKGVITFVNDKFCEISKYSREELIGKDHKIINSGYHSKEFIKNIWQTIASGGIWKGEIKNIAKDGNYYWVDTTIVPSLNDKGKPTKYTAIRSDITAKKKAEEDLIEAKKIAENIKMALDESAIVAITNQKGVITFVNDKFCEISKYSREELIGKDHKIINSGYHSKEFIKNIWQTIASGGIWKGEIKNIAKDGNHYWVDTTIVPSLNDKGKPTQYTAIRADITAKKKAEEELIEAKKIAENSVKIKDEFLRNMSHEIRTPMNSIIGFTDLLLETDLNSEQDEFLGRIKKSSSTLLVLTNDILDSSKLESGKLIFENIDFDLIKLIDQVIKMIEHKAKKKGIELSLFIDSKCPRYINGDPTRLNQVLLNLINNSVKFTEEGEVNIYVKPKTENDDSINITFKIEDTGIGMSEKAQKIIFERFTQARSDTTRKYGGSGLGLSIVKMIVDQRKGEIHLDSTLGKGTTFTIMIPFNKSIKKQVDSDSNSLSGTEVQKPKVFSLNHLKILLVEDNLMNQALAKSRMKSWNCKIDIADNGKIALKQLEHTMYDLILMDIQMPEMDGYEATKRIRKLKPPICEIPIIAMTANASSNDEEKSLKTGMNDYISKPFNPETLYNKIINHTKKKADNESIVEDEDEDAIEYVDLSFLKEESMGDDDLLIFLINTFIGNFESFLTDVKLGIKNEDFEIMYKASHKIISNVRMIATEPMLTKISLIHDLSKEKKEASQISNLLIESEKIFAKMSIVLHTIINEIEDGN